MLRTFLEIFSGPLWKWGISIPFEIIGIISVLNPKLKDTFWSENWYWWVIIGLIIWGIATAFEAAKIIHEIRTSHIVTPQINKKTFRLQRIKIPAIIYEQKNIEGYGGYEKNKGNVCIGFTFQNKKSFPLTECYVDLSNLTRVTSVIQENVTAKNGLVFPTKRLRWQNSSNTRALDGTITIHAKSDASIKVAQTVGNENEFVFATFPKWYPESPGDFTGELRLYGKLKDLDFRPIEIPIKITYWSIDSDEVRMAKALFGNRSGYLKIERTDND